MNASSSEAEEEKEEHLKVDGEKDPDFSQVSSPRVTPLIQHPVTPTGSFNRSTIAGYVGNIG